MSTPERTFGFGQPASPEQIAGWDIDVAAGWHGPAAGQRHGPAREGALCPPRRQVPWGEGGGRRRRHPWWAASARSTPMPR